MVDGGKSWLCAGDATFDVAQSQRCGVCGISQDVALATATQRRLKRLLELDASAVLLPAHDPDALQRLAESQ